MVVVLVLLVLLVAVAVERSWVPEEHGERTAHVHAQLAPVQLDLITLSAAFNNPIGIDYHAPTDSLVMSVNYPSGDPYNFELIDKAGGRRQFSGVSGLSDELKIATVRPGPCQGGFPSGTVFSGTGSPGEILRLPPDGRAPEVPWVTLPGEGGLMRGGLFQDGECLFGGDLVVVTTTGGVWRVSEGGEPRKITDLGQWLEGVAVIPDRPQTYGPWAGRILTGNEKTGEIHAITRSGDVNTWRLGIEPEDFDIVNPGEVFYGVDFGAKRLVAADAGQLQPMHDDILIADERGPLWWVRWNPALEVFETRMVAQVAQWEHVTIAPPSILEVPTPTASPSPTATDASTPTPTRTQVPTPIPQPRRIWLPITVREAPGSGRKPARAVLVLDLSTSMLRTTDRGTTKLDEALRAARRFTGKLRPERGDLVGIVGFNDAAWLQVELGPPERSAAALASLPNRVAHGSRLDRALLESGASVRPLLRGGTEPTIILLTDGLPNRVPTPAAGGSQEDTVVAIAEEMKGRGIRLIAIGLGAPDDILSRLLERVASPGDFHAAPSGTDLGDIYDRILQELACGSVASWGGRCRP